MVNQYGGKMPDAIGIPEEMLRKAATMAVCKINIDSDIRLAMTATIRKYLAEHPSDFDPRAYLAPARTAVKDMVAHKINVASRLRRQGVICPSDYVPDLGPFFGIVRCKEKAVRFGSGRPFPHLFVFATFSFLLPPFFV